MFGLKLRIDLDDLVINLGPLSKDHLPIVAEGFSSLRVHMWTNQLFAQVLENEEEWYERTRKPDNISDCVWAIYPEDENKPIGVTGLHEIDMFGSCQSGIIIWDPDWWGKGVATRAHLARTRFAANYLKRSHINSMVSTKNVPSSKALQRVGYTVWGTEPCTAFREGEWLGVHHFKWINPKRINELFPDGLPETFTDGVRKAEEALDLALEVVTFP